VVVSSVVEDITTVAVMVEEDETATMVALVEGITTVVAMAEEDEIVTVVVMIVTVVTTTAIATAAGKPFHIINL
jgi:hypothetical protein